MKPLENPIVVLMRKHRVPLTRKNYIHIAWMGDPPSEENWSAEDEDLLPRRFQRRPRRPRRRR
jgi:hypothetical protein